MIIHEKAPSEYINPIIADSDAKIFCEFKASQILKNFLFFVLLYFSNLIVDTSSLSTLKISSKLTQQPTPAAATPSNNQTTAASNQTTAVGTQATNQTTVTASNTSPSQSTLFDVYQPVCSTLTCQMPNAICSTNQNCHCLPGYANFQPQPQQNQPGAPQPTTTPNGNYPCQYKQKQQLVAFLLEFFLPFGIGHLYALRTVFGVLKLLFMFVTPCVLCCFVCCGIVTMDSLNSQKIFASLSAMIGLIYSLGAFSWMIIDLVFFGLNKYNDGNNVPLQGW